MAAAVMVTEKLGNVQTWFQTIVETLKVKERYAMAVNFAKERPAAATLIGVAAATGVIPVVSFVAFVVAMLVVGVITLLVVEGTAVLMGGTLLLVTLCGSMIASVVVGASLVSGAVAGRFAWRITTPLRAKMVERLGMANTRTAPMEKKQAETDKMLGFNADEAKTVEPKAVEAN